MFILFLLSTAGIIGISVSCAVVVVILLIWLIIFLNKGKKIKESEDKVHNEINSTTDNLINLLGGKDNIQDIKVSGSRVKVILNDSSKLDKNAILNIYSSVLFMEKQVLFIIGSLSEEFASKLKEKL